MRLVSITKTTFRLGFLLVLGSLNASSQENSPYSRYGLGDIFPGQHIISRGMGGLSSPYVDGQSINFYNPASYSGLRVVTLDVGIGIDNQTLRSENPTKKFTSVNFTPSYLAFGVPLSKKQNIGLVFGLRPITKINYSIQESTRPGRVDSLVNLYEGTGGMNQLFVGLGKKWGGFSVGINTGYTFGRRETNTRVFIFNTDTSSYIPYANGNSATITTYGKAFVNAGLQYEANLAKNSVLRFGFNANFKQTLRGKQDLVRETFFYDNAGNPVRADSVLVYKEMRGTIQTPATYTGGLMFIRTVQDRLGNRSDKASIGVEYETSDWTQFRFYNQPDRLAKSTQVRIGGQFTPDPFSVSNYANRITYRAGVNFGNDIIMADGNELKTFGATVGAALPIRKWRTFDNQFTMLNTALEFGKRGNSKNNITESYFRASIGISLSDIWFVKRRYD